MIINNDKSVKYNVRYEEDTGRRGGTGFYVTVNHDVNTHSVAIMHARYLAKQWCLSRKSEHALPRVNVSYFVTAPDGRKFPKKTLVVNLK